MNGLEIIEKIIEKFLNFALEVIRSERETSQGKLNYIITCALAMILIISIIRGVHADRGLLYLLGFFGSSGYFSDLLRKRGIV